MKSNYMLFFRLIIAMVKGWLIAGLIIFAITIMCKVSFAQSVPNHDHFSLSDVISAVSPTTNDLLDCFDDSNAAYFDATYGSKTMSPKTLLGFRNYHINCPSIGDAYQGGIVAYIYQPGDPGYVFGECHGIIAATADIACNLPWCTTSYILTGANGVVLGTGGSNTSTIVSAHGTSTTYAARSCYELSSGGYTDWVLPSLYELTELYTNRVAIGGFGTGIYWASTEFDIDEAQSFGFSGGGGVADKFGTACVRAIRYF